MPKITHVELFSHLAYVNYETMQREQMIVETSHNFALLENISYKKKEVKATPEETALVVKHVRKYLSREINKRKAKEKLKLTS